MGCSQDEPLPDEGAPATGPTTSTIAGRPTGSGGTSTTTPPGGTAPAFADGGDPLRNEQTHLAQLAIPDVWPTTTGSGQVIAVVDTGVDLTHPDLQSVLVEGINLVTPGTPPQDDNGHGTHVSGAAGAATGNGTGVSGVAPGARIMPVKVLDKSGAGSTATIAEGIDWAATHGATVINLSLGESGPLSRLRKGGEINAALRRASAAGVVLVAASGNDASFKRDYRAGVEVIVVNACDATGAPADFTNAGDPRAVTAPGVDILSTAPTAATDIWANGTSGYEKLSGTSMATPIVAGAAALLLAAGVTPADVATRLSTTAVNPTGDIRLGAGVISVGAALAGA